MLAIAIPCLWLGTLLAPSEEIVKIRNALIMDLGVPADFDWLPANAPASFLVNRGPVPPEFTAIAAEIGSQPVVAGQGEFAEALAIARRLLSARKRFGDGEGNPIQSDNAMAYRAITRDGRGYCADFTQVFKAIAVAARMPVREWGLAFSDFGSGHAFNEVYDSGLAKWVLVDSFHALYFVDPQTHEPLSVREVHDRLLGIDKGLDVSIVPIVPERSPFRSDETALEYYRRGMSQLFLIWGNNVFDYERSPPVHWASHVSRSLQQLTGIVLGVYPRAKIYPVGVSTRDMSGLFRTRDHFVFAACSVLLSVVLFGWQILHLLASEWRPARTTRRVADE